MSDFEILLNKTIPFDANKVRILEQVVNCLYTSKFSEEVLTILNIKLFENRFKLRTRC